MSYMQICNEECIFCQDPLHTRSFWSWCCPPTTTTTCQHTFHSKCIKQWLRRNSHCPLCRAHIGTSVFRFNVFRGLAKAPRYNRDDDVTNPTSTIRVTAHGSKCIHVFIDHFRCLTFVRKQRGIWSSKHYGCLVATVDGIAWDDEALVCHTNTETTRLHDIIHV